MSFPTIEGEGILLDNELGQQLTSKTSIHYFKFFTFLLLIIFFKCEYVLNDLTNAALYLFKTDDLTKLLYYSISCLRWCSKLTPDVNTKILFKSHL